MARAAHSKLARDNLIVYVSCELNGFIHDRPFLAFSKDELELLCDSGTFDLHHALVCVFGCSGKLHIKGCGDDAALGAGLDLQVGTEWVFEPAVPQSLWQDTLIPFTETIRAGSSTSSSTSTSTSTSTSSSASSLLTVDKVTLPGKLAAMCDLKTSVNGIHHILDFDTRTAKTRQNDLCNLLSSPEMDTLCRVTGNPSTETAHLVKKSNPDVVAVHILASRASLYPEVADMFENFEGVYEPRLALLMTYNLHKALDDNCLYLDKIGDNLTVGSLNRKGQLELQNTAIWDQDRDRPLRRIEQNFSIDREPSSLQLAQIFVDWCFGSRILARFGTAEAMAISKRGAVIKAIDMWREEVREAKGSRKRNLTPYLRSG